MCLVSIILLNCRQTKQSKNDKGSNFAIKSEALLDVIGPVPKFLKCVQL